MQSYEFLLRKGNLGAPGPIGPPGLDGTPGRSGQPGKMVSNYS